MDSDYFIQTMHNCCLVNLEDMLNNGTVISKTLIEPPHSFHTACNVATQIIAQVASNQYGGQTISLAHLAPFVQKSRQKIREEVIKEWRDISIPNYEEVINNITESRVREEVKKGVQTIQYQTVTLMTTNGQTPFITVFMYLNEVPEGQTRKDLALIIEEMLRQRIQGVKNEKGVWISPAFPKLIYVLSENNIHEDSPYYYLTELSAKCSAKRLVPDYVSEKQVWELKYPYSKILPISKRRDLWGDETIWGINPFKNLTDEQCSVLDEYVKEYREQPEVPQEVTDILNEYNIPINQVTPLAYCPMGKLSD